MADATHLSQFRRFAQYNVWFNDRLYELVASLSDEERRRDMGAFFGSIHRTLNHILLADRIWLGRISRYPRGFRSLDKTPLVHEFESLAQVLYDDFPDLAAQRRETDTAISGLVAELTHDVLESDLSWVPSSGRLMAAPFWHVLSHLFNHQTHHRGQITTLLSQLNRDPGSTDFILTAFMPEGAD
jgi:uncharacterized damage-inducible protein DinB